MTPSRRRPSQPEPPQGPWGLRLRFFRQSIIRDFICPVLGVVILAYQTYIQSGLLPPYVVALGLVGLPGVARLADLLGGIK